MRAWRGQPQAIRLDTGQEFFAERFISWCAEEGIELPYIQLRESDQKASRAIIGPIDEKCSMPMCLSQWIRCERSPQNGCRVTTKNGAMTHWQVSHPPRVRLDLKPEVLPSKWLLDGERTIPQQFRTSSRDDDFIGVGCSGGCSRPHASTSELSNATI